MGPSELQELLDFDPFAPLRITLASGDIVELTRREGLTITGLSLSVEDTTLRGTPRLRLLSIPNIVMVEPLSGRPAGGRLEGPDE
jgi:hypothetical protein